MRTMKGATPPISENYDYGSSAHLSGSGNQIYHHGVGAEISLDINGTSFSGYDYDSGSHFQGSVNGNSVQLYDYETGQYYNYQV